MKTSLLLVFVVFVGQLAFGQGTINYYADDQYISAIIQTADGNFVFSAGDDLVKTDPEGEVLWVVPDIINPLTGYEAYNTNDRELFVSDGGDILLFTDRTAFRYSDAGTLITSIPLFGSDSRIWQVTRDDHGFRIFGLKRLDVFPYTEYFIHAALDVDLNIRFYYEYLYEGFWTRGGLEAFDDKSLIFQTGEDDSAHATVQLIQVDTLGGLDFNIPFDASDVYSDAQAFGDTLLIYDKTESNYIFQGYTVDGVQLWNTTVADTATETDSILKACRMPDGGIALLQGRGFYVAGIWHAAMRFDYFTSAGTYINSTPYFLVDDGLVYTPGDLFLLDEETFIISGRYFNTVTYESIGFFARVDTAGMVNCMQITGMVYQDANGDLSYTAGEVRLPNPIIQNDGIPIFIVGDTNGNYSYFIDDPGTSVTSWITTPIWDISDPTEYIYTFGPPMFGTVLDDQDFRMSYSAPITDLEVSLIPSEPTLPYIVGEPFYCQALITVNNFGNQIDDGATLSLNIPDYFVVDSIFPPPFSISPTTITWILGELDPFESQQCGAQYHVDWDPLLVGSLVTIGAEVVSLSPETLLDNNTVAYTSPYEYAFDPNDKVVYPTGEGISGDIPVTTTSLQYTIHFQNTGDANAHHVTVRDTLSNYLDPASIQMLSASHDYMLCNVAPGVFEWDFPHINLTPSSTDFPNSSGHFAFTIHLLPDLPIGTAIENSAAIYFDLNAPVITNTTVNTLSLLQSVHDIANAFEVS